MDIILINTMSTGLYNSIKYFLFHKKDKNIIIDPFSCIIKLGLLSYQEEGTKISIIDNQINFNEPNAGQGIIRYLYGDGREDLHNLFRPIQKSVEWYKLSKYKDIDFLFTRAIAGMNTLKKSYGKFETIQHTIDYYISILDGSINSNRFQNHQYEMITTNNTNLISEDINKNERIESDNDSDSDSESDKKNSDYSDSDEDISKHNNLKSIKNNKNKLSSKDTITNQSKHSKQSVKEIKSVSKEKPKVNDLELFLRDLWSFEEIHIVINLFKEFNNKEGQTDQKFVFDSIINYCMMKEKKLHTYIKEKSSILE